MRARTSKGEGRNMKQLREQYEIEKRLACILRNADKEKRKYLYSTAYNKLYRLIPHHPQLIRKLDASARSEHVSSQMRILRYFLKPHFTFLEVGAGDCSLTFEAGRFVKKAYAVDTSEVIAKGSKRPENFELIISDGINIPIPQNSINVAYSNQLMEHLHPDDASEQLKNIYNILVPDGVYLCITPNRLNGPHDISKYFDEIANGLHIREYTNIELVGIFKKAGFRKVRSAYMIKGLFLLFPTFPVRCIEAILSYIPRSLNRRIAHWRPFKILIGIKLIGIK